MDTIHGPFELPTSETDDPEFTALLSNFFGYFANECSTLPVIVFQADNWFGDRWLGFAGVYKGLAGVRNRSLNTILPIPPFRPSRIRSAQSFELSDDRAYYWHKDVSPSVWHQEKNGGQFRHFISNSLYFYYSGNTVSNTTASTMLYHVDSDSYNAWYVMFSKSSGWRVAKCKNIGHDLCSSLVSQHYAATAT